ncbi:hypothetical protein [Bacillus sp. UMB0728]|uniref:hypothetical protein n=1 Tax=Bacillus sp. UMB0728 TaxID=2066052 RepID=UPI000C76B0A2|nr:hypothetical protein [Bacillus sp. UMB0728]PLR70469.1 hypothetical protein CYJ37_23335 [Bacillus sp. UMB0728]
MFKVKGEMLQSTVKAMSKGARKARMGEKACFIKTEGSFVSFFFNGDVLQVEKKIEAEITGDLNLATSIMELDMKVAALPPEEDINVSLDGSLLIFKWGRSSQIACETIAETAPLIEIPEVIENVLWSPGVLHSLAKEIPPFAALANSSQAKKNPCLAGMFLEMDADTGETFVKASNSYKSIVIRSQKTKWFEGIKFSLPTESLAGLSNIFPSDAEVSIGINDTRTLLVFQCGLTTAVSRVLKGNYPDLDSVYTELDDAKSKWIFDRMELIELCRRARQLSPHRPVLSISSEKGKVKANLENILTQQLGVVVEGEQFTFAFNAEYVEIAASLFRSEEIVILFKNKMSAFTLCCEESQHTKTLIGQMQKD